ncbi:MAG: putative RecB family nuclease [Phycisphaerales bacterium]|nr:putative RecB family nuclease [Phycisphaerales bacterium]
MFGIGGKSDNPVAGVITSKIVAAYSECHRQAFLLLHGESGGLPHEYVQIMHRRAEENQLKNSNAILTGIPADVGCHPAIGLPLLCGPLQADCDGFVRSSGGSGGQDAYQPLISSGLSRISEEATLRLAFAGYVIGHMGGVRPKAGALITQGPRYRTISLSELYPVVESTVNRLLSWLAKPTTDEPAVVLNKHCATCSFRQACREKAEQLDDLSLLDRMRPKIRARYHKKGILTVQQLSYQFKPRRRRKYSRPIPPAFKFELQALAIRTGKVYLQDVTPIPRHPVELFLDIEGDPDQCFYYLFGLFVAGDARTEYFSFWADDPSNEQSALRRLCDKIAEFPEGPIYHYGSYDARALKVLSHRYEINVNQITARLFNVTTLVFGRVYFPVRSNSLKSLASYAGARWTQPDANGISSLAWRFHWERSHDDAYKQMLLRYNEDDCSALHLLLGKLRHLAEKAGGNANLDLTEPSNPDASGIGCQLHTAFEAILQSAHEEYSRRRIIVRQPSNHGPAKRGALKGHKAYVRLTSAKAGMVIRVRAKQRCPRHNAEALEVLNEVAEHSVIDLVFTKGGCRKTVTKYVGAKARCRRCKVIYSPPAIRRFEGRVFGHRFQAWALYLRISLRLPYRVINQTLYDLFAVGTFRRDHRRVHWLSLKILRGDRKTSA